MAKSKVEELYQRHIKSLLPDERLCLVELIAHDLAAQPAETSEKEACKMEHGMSRVTLKRLTAFLNEILKKQNGDAGLLE